MFHRLKQLFLCGLLVVSARQASAFSLLGPLETWQTTALGFGFPLDPGGPMTLGDEYRWNSKAIVYAYSPAFLSFFGAKGVDAIDKKIKLLNDLPPVSSLSSNLAEYPLDTRAINYTAQALGVRDIGSMALSMTLEALGLANPERFVYNIYFMDAAVPPTQFYVVKRNYDPVTLQPSSYVNGTLFTYRLIQTAPNQWEAVEIPVDPEAATGTSVVALSASRSVPESPTDPKGTSILTNGIGFFYEGLTRDDVGALRFLLNPQNVNIENLPADAMTGVTAVNTGSAPRSSTGSPWTPVVIGGAAAGGGGAGGAAGGGGAAAPGTLVATALRQGVDKIRFVKGEYDSAFAFTNLLEYQEKLFVNGSLQTQTVQRLLAAPDILFDAADLGIAANGVPIGFTKGLITFDASGAAGAPGTAPAGPGTIAGPVVFAFSKLGPALFNNSPGDEAGAGTVAVWGSFDASTNAPIIFPDLVSIQEQERRVIKAGSPWRTPDAANAAGTGAAAGVGAAGAVPQPGAAGAVPGAGAN